MPADRARPQVPWLTSTLVGARLSTRTSGFLLLTVAVTLQGCEQQFNNASLYGLLSPTLRDQHKKHRPVITSLLQVPDQDDDNDGSDEQRPVARVSTPNGWKALYPDTRTAVSTGLRAAGLLQEKEIHPSEHVPLLRDDDDDEDSAAVHDPPNSFNKGDIDAYGSALQDVDVTEPQSQVVRIRDFTSYAHQHGESSPSDAEKETFLQDDDPPAPRASTSLTPASAMQESNGQSMTDSTMHEAAVTPAKAGEHGGMWGSMLQREDAKEQTELESEYKKMQTMEDPDDIDKATQLAWLKIELEDRRFTRAMQQRIKRPKRLPRISLSQLGEVETLQHGWSQQPHRQVAMLNHRRWRPEDHEPLPSSAKAASVPAMKVADSSAALEAVPQSSPSNVAVDGDMIDF